MLEKFFLDYANNNLQKNPDALWTFISDISCRDEKMGGIEYIQSDCDEYLDIVTAILFMARDEKIQLGRNGVFGIEHLITIAKDIPYQNRRELVDAVMKRYKGLFGESGFKHDLSHFLGIYDIAFSSVYGHDYGFCVRELLKDRVKIFGANLFSGPDRVKCYECDQLHFVHILKEIIEGKEYNEIPWFEYFLQTSNDLVIFRPYFELFKISSKDLKNNRQFHWSLRENKIFEIPLNFDQVYNPPLNNLEVAKPYQTSRFRESLISAAISSLAEFLLHNDRRKLKQCQYCDDFFIAKKIDKRIKYCSVCSPKNKMSREKRRVYMREKYRPKKKLDNLSKKEKEDRNSQIERLIAAGYSRKEAEREYEENRIADREM